MAFRRGGQKPKPVYAFIDSQNLNITVQNLGWKIDWKKFRNFLETEYKVEKAFMFIGYVPEFENLYEQMHEAGYAIVLKPTFDMTRPRPEAAEQTDGKDKSDEEKRPTKGNIDADLVLWAMREFNVYSKAILVSGDGDFYSLVEYLEEQKKLLKILTPSGHYSSLYNKYESYIDRIDQHRRELAYRDYRKSRRPKA